MLRSWWFSSAKMAVFADCKDDVIYDCSTICQKFKGQGIKRLADWMRLQGGFTWKEIDPPVAGKKESKK